MIEIQNLSKYYENASGIKQMVLENITMKIEPGASIAIVGPSGSGKSTLLNILGSLDFCSSGTILFNGNDLNSLGAKELSSFRNKEIGFIFQQHHLLPQLNLLENILLPVIPLKHQEDSGQAKERALSLMHKVGLEDKTDQLPAHCSVGECQRAAVVRALINKPKLLLADEPTGSLDEQNAIELVDLILRLNQDENLTIVMVTHAMALAKKMKKVYRLSNRQLELI